MKHMKLALISALVVAAPLVEAAASTEAVLYKFTGGGGFANGTNASHPVGSLIQDSTGAFFGVTNFGGNGCGSNGPGCGTVFRVAPPATGKTAWTLKFLTSFKDGTVGSYPAAGLVMDSNGALYGTTSGGGTGVSSSGGGTVFRLTPPAPGKTAWTRTTLYKFKGGTDGATPQATLLLDETGALIGTTQIGGTNNNGTVFKLTPPAPGKTVWTETVLYRFAGGTDGGRPLSGLLPGAAGVLYGTTVLGGSGSQGTVYALAPPATGGGSAWTEKILYSFTGGTDGAFPQYVDLVADAGGTIYGATSAGGGAPNMGTVFRLIPPAPGKTLWVERVLHRFAGGKRDGGNPNAGVVLDSAGALYGTTLNGGAANLGVAFKLTPAAGVALWPETVLHDFTGGVDGANPSAGVTLGSGGGVFGATPAGGAACPNQSSTGCGTIFEITP